ncbi:MAG: caspase family protein [Candidatus Pedobacter colombiensis]|uniref:Caspase family protein n=1 Tax=Candidatus Pedobacter colombiensis TaxID=3121371 RepID=A0AAJ5W9J8_9SPHI|nr:caspase family protein [Pedobacter sp.]WEK20424.1 MAG: caspase family protein [Pedobacter sp.]
MKKCAVVIGVDRTGILPELNAAAKGANDFALWAESQAYDTVLLTDHNKNVTVRDIKDAIRKFVDEKIYDVMIVFFSGHGILKSAMDEQWLLSEAPGDLNEAVNVQPSRLIARKSGIPHIVFISDACRSLPKNSLISEMFGSVIFPNVPQSDQDTDIDMFYATKPGDPAYELPIEESLRNYKGVYTRCLLEALYGRVPDVLKKIVEKNVEYNAVLSQELKQYLRKSVPLAAEAVSIRLSQFPDSEVTSITPKHLSKFKTPPSRILVWDGEEMAMEMALPNLNYEIGELDLDIGKQEENGNQEYHRIDSEQEKQNEIVKLIVDANGLNSNRIHTGFTVVGIEYFLENTYGDDCYIFRENGAIQIEILTSPVAKKGFLLKLLDGKSVPLAILPGFIGTLVFENGVLLNVNYHPSRTNRKFSNYERNLIDIETRRAMIAAECTSGIFKISNDFPYILNSASYLRQYKEFDPTLGLYSAYAYAQAGNMEGIASVFSFMDREAEPVLFDVAMLYEYSGQNRKVQINEIAAPFCPLLNQGWSYLSIDPMRYDPNLLFLSRYRLPGLWTTFTEEGTAFYESIYKNR